MQSKSIDMCEGSIIKSTLIFFIPILLTNLLQQFFNVADVVLASNLSFSGNDAVAAVGSTTAITRLLINFFISSSTGSAVIVSQAIGSKNNKDIKEAVHTAVLLSFIFGAILTFTGIAISKTVLITIGTPENILPLSTTYLRTYFLGMVPYMVYNFSAAVLRAVGETRKPLFYLLISGVVKLVLTVIFVKYLNLDVAGLALATTCSQFVSATLAILTLFKRNDNCKIIFKELKLYKKPLKNILLLGIPSGLQSATFSLSSVIIQSSVNSLSHLSGFITGHAAAASVESFTDAITTAFYTTAINFTAQNVGAKNYKRIKKGYFIISASSTLFIGIISIIVCIIPQEIISIYIKNDANAIYWGVTKLIYLFVPLIFQGLMDVTTGALRGLSVSFSSMLISLFGICGVRILWIYTIFAVPKYHTPEILFISYPISWIITFLAELILLKIVYTKQQKSFSES